MSYAFSDFPVDGNGLAAALDAFASASLPETLALARFDADGRLEEASDHFLSLFGYQREDALDKPFADFVMTGESGNADFAAIWAAAAEDEDASGTIRGRRRDGGLILLRGDYRLCEPHPSGGQYLILAGFDVTAESDAAAQSRNEIAALRRTMMVAEFDLDGRILTANENFLAAFGYELSELVGRYHAMFVSAAYAGTDEYRQFWSALRHGRCQTSQLRRFGKDGRELWIDAFYSPIPDAAGLPAKIVKYALDRTLERRVEQRRQDEVRYLADRDALTGLYNRAAFSRHLQELALGRVGGRDGAHAALIVDLDGFRTINDAYGHQAGDALLWVVGQRIRSVVRDQDFIARLGGDQFAVVVPLSPGDDDLPEQLAERLLREVAQPIDVQEERLSVGASIGVALFAGGDGPEPAAEDWLAHVDSALAEAKRSGRGTYRLFDQALHARIQRRQLIERELDGAIRQGDIILHYQPIVRLSDEHVVAFEALARWSHPSLGAVSPDEFVTVAEKTGQIHAMGIALMTQALQFAASLPADIGVAVNLSPMQLRRDGLAARVADLARLHGVDPRRIEIEITETAALGKAPAVLANLRALKAAGFRLSLDDFGTGYSSLSHLLLLSFDRIKIDRSFAGRFLESTECACIVDAVLGLARALGVCVIAEGIETADGAARLREMGCAYAQGYYYGRPIAPAEVDRTTLGGAHISA
ncbi:MAG: EAL domain-containing protein [Pseudomonadota bacterium]